RTVVLKVRFGDFRTITRSLTLPEPLDEGRALAAVAGRLLDGVDPAPGVRLLGVSVSGLTEVAPSASGRSDGVQLRLDAETGGWTAATAAVDAIRGRFGDDSIVPATLAGPTGAPDAGIRVKRHGDQQWGPDS
ncbi:MAG: hypothetical protein H0U89_08635, partial [Acidimicrobiia bacterium]|nr:hypothetical protein [Acidimicrobiia bacterium]